MHNPLVVGRAHELAELDRRLTRAAGGCAIVVGEAGIGKSALVGAISGRLGPAVVGAATEPPASPLRPLVELAVGLIRHGADIDAPALRVHRRALAALLPGLVAGVSENGPIHPVVLADTLCRLQDTMPRAARPGLLVVEDLHWADTDSLAAIESLLERVASDEGTMVVTLRPDGPAWDRVLRLAQRRLAALVELGPLPDPAVRYLIAARLGCVPDDVPAGALAAVAAAEGRPLWIEEIIQTAVDDGSLHATSGGWWTYTDRGRIIPRTLSATVARRLAELERGRTELECAALMGVDIDTPAIAAALGLSVDDVEADLRSGHLTSLLGTPVQGALRFRHDLLRVAVVEAMPLARRRATAGQLLDAVVDPIRPDQLDLAAALAQQAERPTQAAELLLAAGRRDLDRGLPDTAAQRLGRALDLAVPADRLPLRELRVLARALAGDADAALADAGPVDAELAQLPDTGDRRRRLSEAVVRATAGQGRWEAAEHQVVELRGRFPDAPSTAALAALVGLERGRFDEAQRTARAALAAPDIEPTARCEAMEVLGRLARRADLAAAEMWFRRAVAAAEDGGLAVWRARALHELATVAQVRSFDLEPMQRARQAAVDAAAPGLVATVDFDLAAVYGVRFEPDRALPPARMMLDTAGRLGARRQEAFAWVLIGQAHAVAGRRREAEQAADEALRLAPGDAEVDGLSRALCQGLPALLADDLPAALRYWEAAVAALRTIGEIKPYPPWFLWPLLATVLDPAGDGGAAARAETDVAELRVATGANALWHLADAVARGRRGDPAGAAAALSRADERFATLPTFAGYEHLGRRLAAQAALTDGWADPSGWLIRAEDWSSGHGHPGLGRACRSLAGRAGVRRRRAGRGDAVVPAHLARLGITTREMDVLLLVAEGLTTKQVAQRLYLAPRTVKGHLELLLAKTGAANRTQLARHLADPDTAGT